MQEWWRPERFAGRRERLEQRGRMLGAVRDFFAGHGFVEVDTPALQVSPGLEPHLQAFATELHDPRDGRTARRYLHTSPEFAMKKLLVAGMPRIWQLAHVFRDGERSATHHPEFAMLEWYRAGASWRDLIPDCEGLLRACQAAAGAVALAWRGRTADARLPWREISVAEAFEQHCGIDILATAPDPLFPDVDRLARAGAPDRHRAASGRRLGDALLPHLPRPHRAASRHRRADHPLRLPGLDGGTVAPQPRQIREWPSASSSMSAASSSPTPSAS